MPEFMKINNDGLKRPKENNKESTVYQINLSLFLFELFISTGNIMYTERLLLKTINLKYT
jgi:hypothetical protein